MKKIVNLILGIVFLVSACDTTLDVGEAPQLEVTTAKTTYKVGEEVIFNIAGDPRILNFYSGEYGNDYDYHEGRLLSGPDKIQVEFRLREQYQGDRTGSILSILVSSDFVGDRSSFEEVDAANWTDITDRFVIIGHAQGSTGKVDVTEFREPGKPLSFAIKYVFDPDLGNGQGTWPQISSITVEALTQTDNFLLSGPLTSDFPKYGACSSLKNPIQSLNRYYESTLSSNLLVIARNQNVTVDDVTYSSSDYTEEYFVTVPYNVSAVINAGPDKPKTIKGYSDSKVNSYVHVFSEPGVYKVRFVGINHSIKETKETVKELEITVVADE
ncbi:DUF5017 domain-containing protein [Parapedobacter sp. SGR-10]|uniref:DUF5017 domain-containing protein n=1 Tax=Parapedobacter sp. SGR-10 TaxID=2710879 RepID=UPI0013D4DCF6|nr:DUF5017 domain-containing protein [Parapedobacter sp. SGR-10]NGF56385.1 DUF5017 domain-containing protein [Parapedobacter sp. SGR-10]